MTDTPLMRQWREAKARHPDSLLFFRVGDFFELFYEDAREGSRLLGLTLTSRNNGAAAEVPMAGVPARALDEYLSKVIQQGRRAAICDQLEDPAEARGIVRREVVETVTPGTVLSDNLLEAKRNNFLVALGPIRGEALGLAAADLSTGELLVECVNVESLASELGRISPSELLLPRSFEDGPLPGLDAEGPLGRAGRTFRDDWIFDEAIATEELKTRYGLSSLDALGFQREDAPLVEAAGALAAYVKEMRPRGAPPLGRPRILRHGREMLLDEMTRRNLELTEPLRGGEVGGTLVSVLDDTVTPMGGRCLRQWILRPLLVMDDIRSRQEAVDELVRRRDLRAGLRGHLEPAHDLERLAGKVGAGRVTPRELLTLASSLSVVPRIRIEAAGVEASLLREVTVELDPLDEALATIEAGIAGDAPPTLQEGGVVRAGFSEELDELRAVRDGARDSIASLQARERERTGIQSLKVGFNRVFGYYLEVTRANAKRVPDDYVRKQTLANAERYFTPELKDWEEKVTSAEEKILALESELFQEIRSKVAVHVASLQELGRKVAVLDVLACLAEGAERRGYSRPALHAGYEIEIEAGRHPVVETMMPREEFVPNDLLLDAGGPIVILTGPNMAGKSTILRQVGLIQLMAQMGSFVPAARARLPVCDRIFTRVGASDDLARGQSTFMVEMNESAAILHQATPRSLVLLDEIGRGTSTYDGVSIAWAVTEHLHEEIGAKTVFATHYHELTQLADLLAGVKNMTVSVKEVGDRIVFLRRLEEGGADRSYGIHVARLAGLPDAIILRARELLAELEGTHSSGGEGLGRWGAHRPGSVPAPDQLSLFAGEDPLITRLRTVEPDRMTPLEAMSVLSSLREELRRRARSSDDAPGPAGGDAPR